jgi:hypothetical protein
LFSPDLDPDFLPIPDPGVKKAPDPGSGSAPLGSRNIAQNGTLNAKFGSQSRKHFPLLKIENLRTIFVN